MSALEIGGRLGFKCKNMLSSEVTYFTWTTIIENKTFIMPTDNLYRFARGTNEYISITTKCTKYTSCFYDRVKRTNTFMHIWRLSNLVYNEDTNSYNSDFNLFDLNEYSGGEIEIYVGKTKLMKFSLDNIKTTEYWSVIKHKRDIKLKINMLLKQKITYITINDWDIFEINNINIGN